MRKIIYSRILIIFLMLLPVISIAQTKKYIVPQFDYSQIDSLVNVEIKKHALDSNIVIAKVGWSIGDYLMPNDTNYISCDNPFDIFIFYTKNTTLNLLLIDNFGYFKPVKINDYKIINFLKLHFTKMQTEKLKPTDYGSEHKYLQKMYISHYQNNLQYEYSISYSKKRSNLRSEQYKFLQLFNSQLDLFSKSKEARFSVQWEDFK